MSSECPEYDVIVLFAHYGFRKASMDDLARAIGVSRQTLYNRFGTKEAVRDWAVEGFAGQLRDRVQTELDRPDRPARDRLIAAFQRWTGDNIAVLRSAPHGFDIIGLSVAALENAAHDPVTAFRAAIAQFLVENGLCRDIDQAHEAAYALHMADKGLLLTAQSPEEYAASIGRVIDVVLRIETGR